MFALVRFSVVCSSVCSVRFYYNPAAVCSGFVRLVPSVSATPTLNVDGRGCHVFESVLARVEPTNRRTAERTLADASDARDADVCVLISAAADVSE